MLVRVILPPQKLVNGARLKLIVIDGFIERIETKNVPERVRRPHRDAGRTLTGRRGLTLRGNRTPRAAGRRYAGRDPAFDAGGGYRRGRHGAGDRREIPGGVETLTFDNTLSKALGRHLARRRRRFQ